MPEEVQKRGDRGLEKFDLLKIKRSIEKAARQVENNDEVITTIVEKVSNYVMDNVSNLQRVDTQSLRTLILNELNEIYPEVAESWRRYDREVKGRIE